MKYHRLSRYKIRKIILYFTGDITASFVSKILHINQKTINAYYNEIREKILHHSLKEQAKELGEFELDERVRYNRQSTVAIADEASVMERICVRKIIRQRHWVLLVLRQTTPCKVQWFNRCKICLAFKRK